MLALGADGDLAWRLHAHVLHSNADAWDGEPQVEDRSALLVPVLGSPLQQHTSSSFTWIVAVGRVLSGQCTLL